MARTHYDNLKVSQDAPEEVIRSAYRALSQKYHPDKNPGDEESARIMSIINRSYAVLSDADKRKEYDKILASNKGSVEADQFEGTESNNESNQTHGVETNSSAANVKGLGWTIYLLIFTFIILFIYLPGYLQKNNIHSFYEALGWFTSIINAKNSFMENIYKIIIFLAPIVIAIALFNFVFFILYRGRHARSDLIKNFAEKFIFFGFILGYFFIPLFFPGATYKYMPLNQGTVYRYSTDYSNCQHRENNQGNNFSCINNYQYMALCANSINNRMTKEALDQINTVFMKNATFPDQNVNKAAIYLRHGGDVELIKVGLNQNNQCVAMLDFSERIQGNKFDVKLNLVVNEFIKDRTGGLIINGFSL